MIVVSLILRVCFTKAKIMKTSEKSSLGKLRTEDGVAVSRSGDENKVTILYKSKIQQVVYSLEETCSISTTQIHQRYLYTALSSTV